MKLKQLFESQFPTTKEDVEATLEKYEIKNYTINDDLTVDVDGDVFIDKLELSQFPVKFGTVSGDFYCYDNKLTSLEGAPKEVGGDFICRNNNLTSLKGAPREVGGIFNCSQNKLTSLIGAPKRVGRDFYCNSNKLKSLDGIGDVGAYRHRHLVRAARKDHQSNQDSLHYYSSGVGSGCGKPAL